MVYGRLVVVCEAYASGSKRQYVMASTFSVKCAPSFLYTSNGPYMG